MSWDCRCVQLANGTVGAIMLDGPRDGQLVALPRVTECVRFLIPPQAGDVGDELVLERVEYQLLRDPLGWPSRDDTGTYRYRHQRAAVPTCPNDTQES